MADSKDRLVCEVLKTRQDLSRFRGMQIRTGVLRTFIRLYTSDKIVLHVSMCRTAQAFALEESTLKALAEPLRLRT